MEYLVGFIVLALCFIRVGRCREPVGTLLMEWIALVGLAVATLLFAGYVLKLIGTMVIKLFHSLMGLF